MKSKKVLRQAKYGWDGKLYACTRDLVSANKIILSIPNIYPVKTNLDNPYDIYFIELQN